MKLELVGLPGAGKTFMAGQLARERSISVATIANSHEARALALRFIAGNPIFACMLVYLIFRESSSWRIFRHKIGFLLVEALAREQRARLLGDAIIEEGIIGFISVALFDRIVTHEEMHRVLKRCALRLTPRTVVLVEVPRELRVERMQARGRVPRAALGIEHQEQWLSASEKNFSTALSCIRELFPVELIQNS